MKNGQKGFSVIEILIIVVILGLVGTVGWIVYYRQKDDKSETNMTNVTPTPVTTDQPKTSGDPEPELPFTSPTVTENGEFVFKEWGIKISGIRDYQKVQFKIYTESGVLPTEGSFDAYAVPVFKPEFIRDKTCSPGISLYRSTTTPHSTLPPGIKKIGNHYYTWGGGPGPCSKDPDNDPDDQLKRRFLQDIFSTNISAI
jgi:hypothetical protein